MSEKSDRSRVQALLDEGRITADEAEILFAALDEADAQPVAEDEPVAEDDEPEAENTASAAHATPKQLRDEARTKAHETAERARTKTREARASAQEARAQAREDRSLARSRFEVSAFEIPALTPPEPNIPAAEIPFDSRRPPEPPVPGSSQRSDYTFAAGSRVAKLSGFCGDLDVVSDPNISEPVIVGNASVTWDGKNCTIRTPNKDQEGGRNWLNRLHRAAGDLKVTLPEGMAAELAIAAGDGTVRGVKDVRGHFTGGDFNLYGAETLDLTVTAGDVSAQLRPSEGKQRLRVTSGDVDLTLLNGSSVRVSGRATCGDLTLPRGFSRDGSFGTQRFSGTVGAGAAELELRLTAGDVDIKTDVRADVKMESA